MTNPPAQPSNRLLWGTLVAFLAAVCLLFVIRRQRPEVVAAGSPETTLSLPLPDFEFSERSGRSVSRDDLLGKVWIADFVFTRCAGPCPQMSRHMAALQHDLGDLPDVRLVSFSVDPEFDTPKVLRDYAQRFQADPQRWLFLTGELERVYDLAIQGFKITVEEARHNQQIIHDTRFMLVDAGGHVRGYFDSTSPEDLQRLRRQVRELAGD